MSNSSLICYKKISPHKNSPRNNTIKKITIHHAAGNLSIETMGNVFQNREASSNYGIGTDGRIAMYVEEKDRAWTSSNANNDNQAITIEVANDGGAKTNWHVSDKALASLINLCVDICKRNGIKKLNYTGNANGNLTRHNMFAATACPGPYLQSKFPWIAEQVNKRLGSSDEKTSSKITYRIRKSWANSASQVGAYTNLENAKKACDKAGKGYYVFDGSGKAIYPTTPTKKSITEIAKEVLQGKWGNGDARESKLTAAGYNYDEVQNAVNSLASGQAAPKKKTVEQIAREVLQGKWGNGVDRKKRIEAAGYNYNAVQKKVNELSRK